MIRATIARGDGLLPGDHYRCQRCGHEGTFSVTRGRPELCRDCLVQVRIDAQHACAVTGLGTNRGVETDRMGSAKTNRPARERRTVLSPPSAINGKEAVDSC